jgi:erythronate-4-phosphate dehydrogenase
MVPWGSVERVPAAHITREFLARADALLVRSVTEVDEELLQGTSVKFVGTATTGLDHVDVGYLLDAGIGFADAAGSNAESVVDYVIAAMLVAARRSRIRLSEMRVGIVGCGRIGSRLGSRLQPAVATVLRCDPPRARLEPEAGFVSLEEIIRESTLITIHTPLTRIGEDATEHLIGRDEIEAMPPEAWLLNTSRGAVVDNEALRDALVSGQDLRVCLDVWENEPAILQGLMALADVATPHIAGYASDAKLRGGQMVMRALAAHFGKELVPDDSTEAPLTLAPPDPWLPMTDAAGLLTRQMYDLEADDRRMRRSLAEADDPSEAFVRLRRDYPLRREFGAYSLAATVTAGQAGLVQMLGLGRTSDPISV